MRLFHYELNWGPLVKRTLFAAYDKMGQSPQFRAAAVNTLKSVHPARHDRLKRSWYANIQERTEQQSKRELSKKDEQRLSPRLASLQKTTQPRLFMYLSTLVQSDANTGVQRVVNKFLENTVLEDINGRRNIPVYTRDNIPFSIVKQWINRYFNLP